MKVVVLELKDMIGVVGRLRELNMIEINDVKSTQRPIEKVIEWARLCLLSQFSSCRCFFSSSSCLRFLFSCVHEWNEPINSTNNANRNNNNSNDFFFLRRNDLFLIPDSKQFA